MFCTKCGQKLEDGQKFCVRCGTRYTPAETPAPASNNRSDTDDIDMKYIFIPSVLAWVVAGLVRQNIISIPDGGWVDFVAVMGLVWLFAGYIILKKLKKLLGK